MNPQDPLKSAPAITTVSTKETVRDQDKVMLVLAYVGILALIPLLTVKDSPYVTWHAKQGLTIVAAAIALSILSVVLGAIPVLGMVLGCVSLVASVGLFVVDIVAMIKALNGERWRIPVLSDIADKF